MPATRARLIALGGVVGATLRWAVFTSLPVSDFPWAILLVNLLGCGLLGWLVVHPRRSTDGHYGLTVGFCGGLTTFSTFAIELARLRTEHPGTMWVYLGASLAGGLIMFMAGRAAAGAT